MNVVHNAAENRFELDMDGQIAVAEFVRDDNRIIFTHTEVPPQLRRRGVGSLLAQAALDHAQANQLEVVPLCWFIARHINEHPHYRSLLAENKASASPVTPAKE